ncbi:hypothetical protein K7432_005263 [Basidiobolus ranarum]|uniref:Centromere protein S n=1 Tax=Basidiobolus ranarum TaxID=34480 RepID=A0ABR2W3C8_9FUNG
MSDIDSEIFAQEQRLKAAIWFSVNQICKEEESSLGISITPQFIAALTEMVYKEAETVGTDLEHFAKHAKRSVISPDDVKLCARRNDSLYELLGDSAERIGDKSAKAVRKRKK